MGDETKTDTLDAAKLLTMSESEAVALVWAYAFAFGLSQGWPAGITKEYARSMVDVWQARPTGKAGAQ